eukprot:CAMPEP_0170425946 /NCGR_PEP_ID=MMETSP0117_2-20130122/38384_1 /TAXON_ID=400756 /ORGANISM="Durinskia baltica, Strain CSIRO CS-38" /LENGTH=51 /DNA_ID=CAMNT_0010684959 /DNA_START=37 /DNA_END=188 /DNA_ORIENTATION=-
MHGCCAPGLLDGAVARPPAAEEWARTPWDGAILRPCGSVRALASGQATLRL